MRDGKQDDGKDVRNKGNCFCFQSSVMQSTGPARLSNKASAQAFSPFKIQHSSIHIALTVAGQE
eukprot:1138840-Pelagomonas_calceolata.AAC.5